MKVMSILVSSFVAMAALISVVFCRTDDLTGFYANWRSEKLAMLDRDPHLYLVAAFGSSHVHNGFDPRSFDAAFSGATNTPKSFNLGIEGGSQTEQRKMALEYLKYVHQRGGQHAIILLEMEDGMNFQDIYLAHPRAINIYDWSTIKFVAEYSSFHIGAVRWLGRLQYALRAGCLHYLNVGMLSNRIFRPPLDESLIARQTADDRRGLDDLPVNSDMKQYLSVLPASISAIPGEIEPGHYHLLRDLYAASLIKDLKIAYFVMPLMHKPGFLSGIIPLYPTEIDGPQGKVPVINLYETGYELFKPDLWHDDAHLNGSGARVLSRILGAKLRNYYSVNF